MKQKLVVSIIIKCNKGRRGEGGGTLKFHSAKNVQKIIRKQIEKKNTDYTHLAEKS